MLSDDQIDAVTFAQLGDCQWAAYKAGKHGLVQSTCGDSAMTKKEMLDLMRLLSALESWAMSRSERLPEYLHEQIANSTETLEGYILEGKP